MSITRQMPRWQCLAFVALAVLVLAACQEPTRPELTTPGVSLAYQGAPVSTFTVTNTNDAGAGSLRQAIADANASNGFDAIESTSRQCPMPAATPGRVCALSDQY